MLVEKIMPIGFCYGVTKSYETTKQIIQQNPNKKIYMLGWLVHNKSVIDELLKLGVIIIDDSKDSRFNIIQKFEQQTNSILILSAHGTDYKVIEAAKLKGFEVFDLTCKFVSKTHEIIKQKLSEGYSIYFIGKKGHPETNAILSIDNSIKLIDSIESLKMFDLSQEKVFCTNQTTFNASVLDEIVTNMKDINENILFENDICNATRIRQTAIANIDPGFDICLIIGDQKSSNANELYNISLSKVESYQINSFEDINITWFEGKKKCGIIGAASTPSWIIDKIYNKLIDLYK
ncbi:MAG: 4-hydroxy-3-methylbut-2-enyl diphosphate reductase [Mycoplasma sp.]